MTYLDRIAPWAIVRVAIPPIICCRHRNRNEAIQHAQVLRNLTGNNYEVIYDHEPATVSTPTATQGLPREGGIQARVTALQTMGASGGKNISSDSR